jgi:hypothetical protein
MRLSQTLASQQARWDSLAIRHYVINVSYTSGDTICGPAAIEVREGRVIGEPGRGADHWFPGEVCDDLLNRFTIDGAFHWIDDEVGAFLPGQMRLRAGFDPVFGFPTSVERMTYGGMPTADCCWEASWRNLQPLNP